MKLLSGLEVVAKVCRGPCGQKKAVGEFNRKRDAPDGRQPYCRACGRARTGTTMRRLRALEKKTNNRPRDRLDRWLAEWLRAHPERQSHG